MESLAAAEEVLAFWFADALDDPAKAMQRMAFWFESNPQTDRRVAERFAPLIEAASTGRLAGWEALPHSRLALVIVLDQFPRNVHRAKAAAFQHDEQALAVARRGVTAGDLSALKTIEQAFLLMPFQHCEDLACQREGVALFERMTREAPQEWRRVAEENLKYARLHLEIIERFGRFPHRNAILGRPSTPAETEYLRSNTQSFGQSAQ
jgi:uncharacterized protein (DUF924 family)